MITRDTPWRHISAVPFAIWQKRINDAGGLAEAAGYDVWLALGDDSALALEMLGAESSYASDFDAIPASKKNPWNLQVAGQGLSFRTIAEAAQAWRNRLYDPNYKQGIYTRTQTIYELISVYAPRSDGNDPEGYTDKVVAGMNRNGFDPPVQTPSTPPEPIPGEGEPMPNVYRRVPHPPYSNLPVSKPNGGGYGYTQIPRGSRKIVGVMNHETQGRGTGQWYRDFFSCPGGQRCSDALVDYLITRDGTIYRYNDPANDRSPWANGGPLGLEGDGPAFYAKFGASGVNNRLISIEHEALYGEPWTDAQVRSSGLLNAYWHDQDGQDWESYPYVPRYSCVTSLAHFEIGTSSCGTKSLPSITRVQAVARGEMKKWQTGADVPSIPDPPSVPDQPQIPTLPGGAVLADVVKAFGTLTKHTPDGKTKVAPFDPRGVISLSYTHRCVAEFGLAYDRWPAAEDWWAISDSGQTLDIVTFSNEWQMVRIADRQGIMWARFADAELEAA